MSCTVIWFSLNAVCRVVCECVRACILLPVSQMNNESVIDCGNMKDIFFSSQQTIHRHLYTCMNIWRANTFVNGTNNPSFAIVYPNDICLSVKLFSTKPYTHTRTSFHPNTYNTRQTALNINWEIHRSRKKNIFVYTNMPFVSFNMHRKNIYSKLAPRKRNTNNRNTHTHTHNPNDEVLWIVIRMFFFFSFRFVSEFWSFAARNCCNFKFTIQWTGTCVWRGFFFLSLPRSLCTKSTDFIGRALIFFNLILQILLLLLRFYQPYSSLIYNTFNKNCNQIGIFYGRSACQSYLK